MFEREAVEAEREAQYLNEENAMVDKRTQRERAAADYREKLVVAEMENALKVIVLTPHVRAYLAVMDPKALEQAQQALGLPVSRGGSPALIDLMETFRLPIFTEVERLRKIDAEEDEREDRKEAMAEHNGEAPLHELPNDQMMARIASFDTREFCDACDGVKGPGGDCECAPPLPNEAVVTVPPVTECDCAEKAPADRYWVCPKCDAEWFPKE